MWCAWTEEGKTARKPLDHVSEVRYLQGFTCNPLRSWHSTTELRPQPYLL
jgi:hypothetical protein